MTPSFLFSGYQLYPENYVSSKPYPRDFKYSFTLHLDQNIRIELWHCYYLFFGFVNAANLSKSHCTSVLNYLKVTSKTVLMALLSKLNLAIFEFGSTLIRLNKILKVQPMEQLNAALIIQNVWIIAKVWIGSSHLWTNKLIKNSSGVNGLYGNFY